jgi:hypothetical protein
VAMAIHGAEGGSLGDARQFKPGAPTHGPGRSPGSTRRGCQRYVRRPPGRSSSAGVGP